MSGHSKWHSIKHKKGAADKARGKLFAVLIRQIEVAARTGGGDPESNATLRTMVQKARDASVPVDTIQRAIRRGTGEEEGVTYESVSYEGYAPGGVALMVACLTDNRARTAPDIRFAFDRHGGSIGSPGSVSFLFAFRAIFAAEKGERDEDAWTELALEAGAEDVRIEGDVVTLVAPAPDFLSVKQKLEEKSVTLLSAQTGWMPGSTVAIADKETARKVLGLIDVLEENDDVQNVYANYEIPDDWARELQA